MGTVERSVRVLDGAVAIFDAVMGAEAQTKTVWKQAERYGVPRIAYVNKMDKIGADMDHTLRSMEEKLNCKPIAIQIPVGESDKFRGVIDLVAMEFIEWSSDGTAMTHTKLDDINDSFVEGYVAKAYDARAHMIEKIADLDEHVADLYLQGNEDALTSQVLKDALRRITITQSGVPVVCGTSLRNMGVQPVLDAIVDFLPCPSEVTPPKAIKRKSTEVVEVPIDAKAPLCALAFKVIHDPQMGYMVFLRVYSGVLKSRAVFLNSKNGEKERITKLFQMHANFPHEINQISAGNIGVAIGLKHVATGDTILSDKVQPKDMIELEGVSVPAPVFFCSIESESSAAQATLDKVLDIMQKEDPSLKVDVDPETGQTLVKGMGELHLEIVKDRLENDFKVECTMGRVQIAYRESISGSAEGDHTYDGRASATGNSIMWANVSATIQPRERGSGNTVKFELEKSLCDPSVECVKPYMRHVEQGVQSALMRGPLLGYSMEDVGVVVRGIRVQTGGGKQQELANEAAVSSCATQLIGKLLAQVAEKNEAELLEPSMNLEIATESQYVGSICNDISSGRRGTIKTIDSLHGEHVIHAEVPLSEMIGYSSHLRSMTRGHAHYHMEISHYIQLSEYERQQLLNRF